MRAAFAALLLCALSPAARSQDAGQDTRDDDETAVTELDEVRVTAPRLETFDPYRFRNPIDARGSALDRYYHEPPTPEEISLHYGGYIQYGITQGLLKAAEQVTRLPGWKHQIQSATARPPPLDDVQQARAVRLTQDAPADAPGNPPPTP